VGASTLSAANEAQYRAAPLNLSSDITGPHTIEITASAAIPAGSNEVIAKRLGVTP
jgi:hypothetical protein